MDTEVGSLTGGSRVAQPGGAVGAQEHQSHFGNGLGELVASDAGSYDGHGTSNGSMGVYPNGTDTGSISETNLGHQANSRVQVIVELATVLLNPLH